MQPASEIGELLARGVDLFLRGETRDATAIFHEVLARDPSNVQARHYLQDLLALGSSAPGVPSMAPLSTGWDDGPALQPSIEMSIDVTPAENPDSFPANAAQENADRTPQRVTPDLPELVASLLREARNAAARGDFTTAVDRCDRLLEIDPSSMEGFALQQEATETLVKMYESELGGPNGVPEVVADQRELIWLELDSRAGFVLSQIDGSVTYDELHSVCGMSRLETMRILARLQSQKAIRTRGL